MRNTLERNGEQVREKCATREKGMGNTWERNTQHVRKECWNRWEMIRKQVKRWCSAT